MLNAYAAASTTETDADQPENGRKARILLADDHVLVAQTLSILLAPHFDVVGVINDGKVVVEEVGRLKPEVLLLDVAMPGRNGLDAARTILGSDNGKERSPNTKIVFLTMHTSRMIVKEAFRAGASAFLVKHCAANELVRAIRTVLSGGTYVSPEVQDDSAQDDLSERQTTVLRLIAQGCRAKQIALQLNISSRTAEFHKNSIMDKLKLRTTSELTRYAIEQGLAS